MNNRKSERLSNKSRLDYEKLHRYGQRIEKVQEAETETSADETSDTDNSIGDIFDEETSIEKPSDQDRDISRLLQKMSLHDDDEVQFTVLEEDINDHIEENPMNIINITIDDVDASISKIEMLRSQFRNATKKVERVNREKYEKTYEGISERIISKIKDYIINAKERKSSIRGEEKTREEFKEMQLKNEEDKSYEKQMVAANFLINEVERLITELSNEFTKINQNAKDDEILRKKEALSENILKMERLSTKFQRTLEVIPFEYPRRAQVIKTINDNYNKLIIEKDIYENFVKLEFGKPASENIMKKSADKIYFKLW